MRIFLAKHGGFCFGVNRAFQIALTPRSGKVFILGDICHNSIAVAMLKEKGVVRVDTADEAKGGTMIVGAGGADKNIMDKALDIADATCPNVQRVFDIASRSSEAGNILLVVGDPNHDEVKNTISRCKSSFVICSICDATSFQFSKNKSYVVVAQTTLDSEYYKNICSSLFTQALAFGVDNTKITVVDTLCPAVTLRIDECSRLAQSCNAVIVVGDNNSANCNTIYNVAKSINENSYFISDYTQIPFLPTLSGDLCVTGGASVPKFVIEKVAEVLSDKYNAELVL